MDSFNYVVPPLEFNKKDYTYIDNNEVTFISLLLQSVADAPKAQNNINEFLKADQLLFKDNKIINQQGACSEVFIEKISETIYIRKKAKKHDIQSEFKILKDFYNQGSTYVISVGNNISFDGTSYLMEFAEDSLESYIKNNRKSANKIEIIKRVIDIVSHIHQNNILHRDLHPGNFLFIKKAQINTLKLSDFGFACEFNDLNESHKKKAYYGRLGYAAPEQLKNINNASIRSEIYSVGRIINFIQTGHPDKTNHELHDITEKCTRTDPQKRYQIIAELKEELDLRLSALS